MPYIGNITSDFSVDTGNITNRAVTALKLSPSSVGSNGQVLGVDGSGNLQWTSDPAGQWITTGSDIYFSAGSVGIGESSPGSKLHVKIDDTGIAPHASAQICLERAGTNYLQFLTANDGTSGLLFGDGDDIDVSQIKYDHSAKKLYFTTETDTALTIDENQNVGIGTTSPSELLDVEGTIECLNELRSKTGNDLKLNAGSANRDVFLQVNDSTLMTVQGSTGNVGIGTTAPVASATNYNGAALHLHQTGDTSAGSQIHLTNGATGAAAGNGAFISMWSDDDVYITNQETDGQIKFNTGGNSDVLVLNDSGAATFSGTVAFGGAGSYVGSNVLRFSPAGTAYIDHDVNDQDIYFRVSSSGAPGTLGVIPLVIKGGSDGKIGIGTTGPSSKLHVASGSSGATANTSSVLTIESSAADYNILQFLSPNTAHQQVRFGDPQDNGHGFIDYDHGNAKMLFGANGPTKLTIEAGGDLNIADGNLVLASGHGINFDPQGAGNVNLLDDYEEGVAVLTFQYYTGSTWANVTFTSAPATTTCNYVKIGQLVHINLYTGAFQVNTGNNETCRITGLPFPSASGHYSILNFTHGTSFVDGSVNGYVESDSTSCRPTITDNTNSDKWAIHACYMMMAGCYRAAS